MSERINGWNLGLVRSQIGPLSIPSALGVEYDHELKHECLDPAYLELNFWTFGESSLLISQLALQGMHHMEVPDLLLESRAAHG